MVGSHIFVFWVTHSDGRQKLWTLWYWLCDESKSETWVQVSVKGWHNYPKPYFEVIIPLGSSYGGESKSENIAMKCTPTIVCSVYPIFYHFVWNLIEKVKAVEGYQTLLEYSSVRLRFYIYKNICFQNYIVFTRSLTRRSKVPSS